MEHTGVKEYIEKVIEAHNALWELEDYNGSVGICVGVKEIILDHKTDIQEIAGIMGCDLKENSFNGEECRFEYFFIYNGVKVMKLTKKRLPGYGTD